MAGSAATRPDPGRRSRMSGIVVRPESVPRPMRMRGLAITLALLGLFVLAVWWAFSAIGWEAAARALSRLSLGQILLLLALASLHYVLRAMRWHVLARTAGLPTSLGQNLLHFFAGFAMVVTPGRVGELVRLRWMCGESGWTAERAAPIVLADRAVELAGMLVVIVLCVALTNTGIAGLFWLLTVSAAIVAVSLNPRLLTWGVERLWGLTRRSPRFFVRLRRMTLGLEPFARLGVLSSTTLMSAAGWFLEGVAFYLVLTDLGAEIAAVVAIAIFLVAVLSGALSGLPGGLGGTEAVAVGLVTLQGVPLDLALVATVMIRVTTLWYAVTIGIAVFPIAEARLHRRRGPG